MRKQMLIVIIGLTVVFGGIFVWNMIKNFAISRYFATYQPPAVTVTAESAKAETWQNYISAVGTLSAINGVTVSTQIAGIIKTINFYSGQLVNKGDLIIQIDDSVEQAELLGNKAQVLLTTANLDRYRSLQTKNYASKADYDQATANYQQALANQSRTQAIIDQKHITAPFAGKIGIRQVNLGQYVAPGTPLVSLQAIDPLYVNFSVPEQNLKFLGYGQKVTLKVDSHPKETFTGTLTAIDSIVDVQTHNIQLQATIPNPAKQLYPGLFANIQVVLPSSRNVVIVPETSIDSSLFGDSVFILQPDPKSSDKKTYLAKRVYVKTGEHRDNKVAVLEGLKANEFVATSGQLKLDNGTRVVIDNSVTTNTL